MGLAWPRLVNPLLHDTQQFKRSPELQRIGATLGPYRLIAPLGAGGMATVFSAVHIGLQKGVAVKVLRQQIAANDDLRRRFVQEGITASRVRHPHIVDVTDVGEDRGHAYLVMELLEGESLAARIEREPCMQIERALELLLPIVAALSAAHLVGVVHRDVKPENVFLVAGARVVPKLVDFGISMVSTLGARRITDGGTILGTPHYMAPEQARGELVDMQADQYALAVVLYEVVSGRLPYENYTTDLQLIARVAEGRPIPLSKRWPSARAPLDAVLRKAMAGDPAQRYAAIADFGRALLPFASSRAVRHFRELVDPSWASMPIEAQTDRASIGSEVATLSQPVTEAETRPTAAQAPESVTPSEGFSMRPPPPSRGVPMIAIGIGLALVLALVFGQLRGLLANDPAPAAAITPAPEAVTPTTPIDEHNVVVRLRVMPADALISVDGHPFAVGTAELVLAPRGPRHHVVVSAEGFVQWESYLGDRSFTRELTLSRALQEPTVGR